MFTSRKSCGGTRRYNTRWLKVTTLSPCHACKAIDPGTLLIYTFKLELLLAQPPTIMARGVLWCSCLYLSRTSYSADVPMLSGCSGLCSVPHCISNSLSRCSAGLGVVQWSPRKCSPGAVLALKLVRRRRVNFGSARLHSSLEQLAWLSPAVALG